MAQFRPFRGILYNEPGSTPQDGVMDISAVAGTSLSVADISAMHARDELAFEAEPALYMYRAGWRDVDGRPRQISGVIGFAEETADASADAFVQENSVMYASADALPQGEADQSIRLTQVDTPEFDLLLQPAGMPLVTATLEGIHYRLWPLRQRGVISTICDFVSPRLSGCVGGLVAASTSDRLPPTGLIMVNPTSI